MERTIQPGDYITITYAPVSFPITQITAEGIYFRTPDGESLSVPNQGEYIIQGLTVPHKVTFDIAPQAAQVPQVTPPDQTTQPALLFPPTKPTKPKGVRKPPAPGISQPDPIQPGQTGKVYGLGAMYNDEGNKVRPYGEYRFTALRTLRNGSNVIIQLQDGSSLTLRWRTHSNTTGRGWTIRRKEHNTDTYELIGVELD